MPIVDEGRAYYQLTIPGVFCEECTQEILVQFGNGIQASAARKFDSIIPEWTECTHCKKELGQQQVKRMQALWEYYETDRANVLSAARDFYRNGKKIECIKHVKKIFPGLGLLPAKYMVDGFWAAFYAEKVGGQ